MGKGYYFTIHKKNGDMVYESEAFTMSDGDMGPRDMCIINAELELAGQANRHGEQIEGRNYEVTPGHQRRIDA